MNHNIPLAAVLVVSLCASAPAATLGVYQFTGGSVEASNLAPGVVMGDFARGSGVIPVAAADLFASRGLNYPTIEASLANDGYIGFTIAPQAGYRLSVTQFGYDYTWDNGNNTAAMLQSSVRGFSNKTNIAQVKAGTGRTLNVTGHNNLTAPTEFRVYAWGSTNASKVHRADNIILYGETQARASMQAEVAASAPARVLRDTAGVGHTVSVTNDALAPGTLASQALNYNLGVFGSGLSLASSGGANLAAGATATHFVSVDTSTAGLKSGVVQAASANAWRVNGNELASFNSFELAPVVVLDRGLASFDLIGQDRLHLDFGAVRQHSSVDPLNFSIHNLLSSVGFTAGLDLDLVYGKGHTGKLTTNLASISGIEAGSSADFLAGFDTSEMGDFLALYTLLLSDEKTAAGTPIMQSLQLTLTGSVLSAAEFSAAASLNAAAVPEPSTGALLLLAALAAAQRRRRGRAAGLCSTQH